MKRMIVTALALALPLGVSAADPTQFRAELRGSSEVPAINTEAKGRFNAYLAGDGLHYELLYRDLRGAAVTQAHIHLGERHTNGGVMVWLCSNLASPPTPAGVPACPSAPGRVSGVIAPLDVVGPAAQGVAPGEFRALVKALHNRTAYANVHTDTFPSGEVRGQVARLER